MNIFTIKIKKLNNLVYEYEIKEKYENVIKEYDREYLEIFCKNYIKKYCKLDKNKKLV